MGEKGIQMAITHIRYSTSLIRETQIKTIMIYHFTPVRIAVIKKPRNNKCWQGCAEIGTPISGGIPVVESKLYSHNGKWYGSFL